MTDTNFLTLTDNDWRERLDDMSYHVLRQAGTERPGTGRLLDEERSGSYQCKACGAELFEAGTKFDSHCGWPSFYESKEGAVRFIEDRTLGMVRTEVRCATCDSHLGHIFPDAPQTPTGNRYCMNSVSLTFTPDDGSGSVEG